MAVREAAGDQVATGGIELRRYQRVRLNLLGRYMLEDRREFPCQTIDVSAGSCAFTAPVPGRLDERVIAYIEQLGRIEGIVARLFDGGFAMSLRGSPRLREKLAARLVWIADPSQRDFSEDRRYERTVPATTASRIVLPDGREYACRIVDLSLGGALLVAEARPPVGSPVRLGSIRAEVVRHSGDEMAIEFATLQTHESLQIGISARLQSFFDQGW